MKTKGINQTEFLSLLQKVLPKATKDPHLASKIYEQVAQEVRLINSIESFEKFCEEGGLPNLEPQTVSELQQDLAGKFGEGNVAITAEGEALLGDARRMLALAEAMVARNRAADLAGEVLQAQDAA